MVGLLNGLELQGFIKERQLHQVRNLRQQFAMAPRLLILKSPDASPVIDAYIRMKVRYAADILISVLVETCDEQTMKSRIKQANIDSTIQGIIVQLPLKNVGQTNEICNLIDPIKDVDGLGSHALFPSATAQAIDWLLVGYNVELRNKRIVIVGNGKLVGRPLYTMWQKRGLTVTVLDDQSGPIGDTVQTSDIVVSATGVPHLITNDMVHAGMVIIDAGTASEHGVLMGDVDDAVRQRHDIVITPRKGGVGPLTYTVLFDHLIEVCLRQAGQLPESKA